MNTIQVTKHYKGIRIGQAKLVELIDGICRRFGVRKATISVGIVGDDEITRLNRQFLNHKGTTDCLSFDLSDPSAKGSGPVFDLIVNGEMARRQATRRGHSARAELALYITHTLLHQLGFDDLDEKSAARMHLAEDEILQYLGYGTVYNTSTRTTETGG
jgi:probable rRNA maturation factor